MDRHDLTSLAGSLLRAQFPEVTARTPSLQGSSAAQALSSPLCLYMYWPTTCPGPHTGQW